MTTPATKTDTADANQSSRNIGPYKVIGRLGKGGMAEVLLTIQNDEHFKRLVVVKRVLTELEEEDEQFIKMFLDEARLAARLNHPNVVQTYEVGQDGASPFLAMEFLDGQSLNVLQRRTHSLGRKIPVEVALKIFYDVIDGLHYAHELKDFDGKTLGVIHRDVTPSNIFIKYDGTTKLVDFGIAKSTTNKEKTKAGMLKGKMAYMAPEQFKDAPITRTVDLWAMGIVMWETLAGERLFRGKNDFDTVQAVMKREIPKLSQKRTDVPAEIDALIAKALERDSSKRFATGEEMKTQIEDLAFKIGKPLRKTDVAKLMQELFAEAMLQNQNLVKEFLEKDTTAQGGSLRFNKDGKLESRAESTAEASSTSVPADSSGSQTMPEFTTPEVPTNKQTKAPDKTQLVEGSKADNAVVHDDDDEDEPRPVWHWAVLALVLVAVGVAVWQIVSH